MQNHYFIGIPILSSISGQVDMYQKKYELQRHYKVIPHIADLHVTLLYIGAMPSGKIDPLTSVLETTASHHKPFSIQIDGLSYFGSPSGPRVVYLTVQPIPALAALQKSLENDVTELLDTPITNRFTPHVTIAKKRKATKSAVIEKEKMEPVEIAVPSFSLFAIHPKQSPKYEAVATFEL